MRSFVTFLLLALLGAIAAFLISNTTPIALTFLGITSVALPLAIWMGGALLAGVATGLWFSVLFRLAERRGARQESKRQKAASFGPDDFAVVNDGYESGQFSEPLPEQFSAGGQGQGYRPFDDGYRDEAYKGAGDRDYRDYDNGNWDRESQQPFPSPRAPVDLPRREEYARQAREDDFEMVEAEPPVYDANYRVIQPPEPADTSSTKASAEAAMPDDGSKSYTSQSYNSDSYRSDSYGSESYGSDSYGSEPYDNAGRRSDQRSEPSSDQDYSSAYSSDYSADSYSSDSYGSDTYSSGNYASDAYADKGSVNKESSFRKTSDPARNQPSQQKSQPKDDWDIESDLDW